MDHRNTGIECFQRILEAHFLAFKHNLARGWRMDTDKAFHQRRLTRTVFAHQRMNGARAHLELHALERAHAGEILDNIGHLQDIFLAHCFSPHYYCVLVSGKGHRLQCPFPPAYVLIRNLLRYPG